MNIEMNSQREPVKDNEMSKRNNAIMKALETKEGRISVRSVME